MFYPFYGGANPDEFQGQTHVSAPTDDQSKELFPISVGTQAEAAKLGR